MGGTDEILKGWLERLWITSGVMKWPARLFVISVVALSPLAVLFGIVMAVKAIFFSHTPPEPTQDWKPASGVADAATPERELPPSINVSPTFNNMPPPAPAPVAPPTQSGTSTPNPSSAPLVQSASPKTTSVPLAVPAPIKPKMPPAPTHDRVPPTAGDSYENNGINNGIMGSGGTQNFNGSGGPAASGRSPQ